jgi:hypothetical protein
MRFLGRKPSHGLVKFTRTKERELGCILSFKTMEEHPKKELYLNGSIGTCAVSELDKTVTIYVHVSLLRRDDYPVEAREVTAVHEVLHVCAGNLGFPTTARPTNVSEEEPDAWVGARLGSKIQHYFIDKEMQSVGFDPNILLDKDAEFTYERWRKDEFGTKQKWTPEYAITVVDYIKSQTRYRRELRSEATEIMDTLWPDILETGERGLAIVKECDCAKPDGALEALIRLRDLLRLDKNRIVVKDRLTGATY